jgi:hypothetical protein
MDSFFLNAINSLSLLKLPWLILVSGLVIAIETFVLYFFWKEWRLAAKISLLTNIGSSLIAVPLLLISGAEGSIWVTLIAAAAAIKDFPGDELIIYLWGVFAFSLIFVVTFVISVLTEYLIGKVLKAPEEKRITYFTIANLISYSMIVLSLIGLGTLFGLTNQDPYVDIFDFVYTYFVQPVPLNSTLILLQLSTLLIGILLVVSLLIHNYRRPSSKSIVTK